MTFRGYLVVLSLVLSGLGLERGPWFLIGRHPDIPTGSSLIHDGDLVYDGGFRLNAGDVNSSFDYSGYAGPTTFCYNPDDSSLFVAGHQTFKYISKVTIPALVIPVSSVSEMNVADPTGASTLMFDPTNGHLGDIGPDTNYLGGCIVYNSKLYVTAWRYYDGDSSTNLTSHFVMNLDGTGITGPWRVSDTWGAGMISGYFADIPSPWRTALGGPVLNGLCCVSIISRTSYGPNAFAITPSDIGVTIPAPAFTLLNYPDGHQVPGAEGATAAEFFNLSTLMGGMVFPTGHRSILFFGRVGTAAEYCYGDPGDFCPARGGIIVDPADSAHGPHNYPYTEHVWAFDAADLASVKSGDIAYDQPRPYAMWSMTIPFTHPRHQIAGVAYDAIGGRIFLLCVQNNDPKPIVQVFHLAS